MGNRRQYRDCPTCKGEGFIMPGLKCHTCRGKGFCCLETVRALRKREMMAAAAQPKPTEGP